MRITRLVLLTALVLYLPVGFYWYIPYGEEMTQPERQAWFIRGLMSVLVLMLAYQTIPGSRLRVPCIVAGTLGLFGSLIALSSPTGPLWAPATGLLQLAIVICAYLIAFGEESPRGQRLGVALGVATTFGLCWFTVLRAFFSDPGGPELAYASRVLGTEWAPAIPVGVHALAATWAWSR